MRRNEAHTINTEERQINKCGVYKTLQFRHPGVSLIKKQKLHLSAKKVSNVNTQTQLLKFLLNVELSQTFH